MPGSYSCPLAVAACGRRLRIECVEQALVAAGIDHIRVAQISQGFLGNARASAAAAVENYRFAFVRRDGGYLLGYLIEFDLPGAGLDKWFFYPGFTPATGGLQIGRASCRERVCLYV